MPPRGSTIYEKGESLELAGSAGQVPFLPPPTKNGPPSVVLVTVCSVSKVHRSIQGGPTFRL